MDEQNCVKVMIDPRVRQTNPTISALVKNDIKRIWKAGAVHIIVSRYLTQIIALLIRVLSARFLGAANIGHIAVVQSALAIIQLPAAMGSFTAVNKFVAESHGNRQQENNILSTALLYNLITSVITIIVVYILLFRTQLINDGVANSFLKILLLLLPLIIMTQVFDSFMAGQQQMRRIAKINTILAIMRMGIVLFLSYFYALKGWLLAQSIMFLLSFIFFAVYTKENIKIKYDGSMAKNIIRIGSWAFLGQAVGTVLLQFDTLCVSGIMKDAEATGIYNTAALISQQLVSISGGVLYTVFPYVAKNKGDVEKIKKTHKEMTKKLFILNMAIYLAAILLAPYFFPLFGAQFKMSVAPFRILGLAVIVRSLYILTNTYLDALGRTDLTFVSGLFAAAVNIALNLYLIPKHGIMGAAWATVISLVISFMMREVFLHNFIFQKKRIR